jgi:hypothetical protein
MMGSGVRVPASALAERPAWRGAAEAAPLQRIVLLACSAVGARHLVERARRDVEELVGARRVRLQTNALQAATRHGGRGGGYRLCSVPDQPPFSKVPPDFSVPYYPTASIRLRPTASAALAVGRALLLLRHERDVVDQGDHLRLRRQRCVEIHFGGLDR